MNERNRENTVRRARCDIRKEADNIMMRLEMPGVDKSGLEINVEGDSLKIVGRRPQDGVKGDCIVREILPGDFSMEYTLDETIDRGSIGARLENGVLTLTLGLSEAVKPRKIKVVAK